MLSIKSNVLYYEFSLLVRGISLVLHCTHWYDQLYWTRWFMCYGESQALIGYIHVPREKITTMIGWNLWARFWGNSCFFFLLLVIPSNPLFYPPPAPFRLAGPFFIITTASIEPSKIMQCPNSPSMRSTTRSNFEPRTPSTLMSRLVIHSPEAVRQRFNNADRPSTDLQKRLMHCSSSPKPTHPNLNMFLSGESKRIRMVRHWK